MDFPALKDTNFPNLQNMDVYRYQNNFDYERWTPETKIKLVTVPWDVAYKNVVAFADDAARDTYFKNLAGHSVELTSDFARMPGDSVRVSVPIDVVNRYNYVCVEIPQYTPEEPLDYENARGTRRLYYFIVDTVYRSPSATEIMLALDVWTTYINSVEVASMFLERGHAPMYDMPATEYLKNPRANNNGLLTPDINYGSADIVAGAQWQPLHAADERYLLLASTIPYAYVDDIGAGTDAGASTPPTYADRETRSGYQEIVNGFRWSEGGITYQNATSPASLTTSSDGNIPNGLTLYAIRYVDFVAYMGSTAELCPHFIESITQAFVVPRSLLELGASHELGYITLYEVAPVKQIDAASFTLSKAQFNYPPRYAELAKLYTFPYASLEFSDDNGNAFDVRIENTGQNIQLMEQVSLAAPFLKWDVLFTNLDGSGRASYAVRNLFNETGTETIPGASFRRFMFAWDIPTYAIYLESSRAYALENYASADFERESAIVSYQNSVRGSNTTYENALDSNETSNTNTLASNATAKTNTDASADTMLTNVGNAADTSIDNNDAAVAALNANSTRSNLNAASMNILNNIALGSGLAADQRLQDALLNNRIETRASSTVASGLGGLAEGAIQGAAAGAAVGSVVPGVGTLIGAAVGGAISAIPSVLTGAVTSELHNYVLATSESNELSATKTNQSEHLNLQQALNSGGTNLNVAAQTETTANNVSAMETQTDNNAALMRTNAGNDATTTKANATRNKTTGDANANRTKATGDANAGYTRDTAIENAKASLELAQDRYKAGYKAADAAPARAIGSYSGDATQDIFNRRGVHMRVKTQSKDAIARAGDYFIRFGYAYDGFYPFESWTKGEDYCYWKTRDVELLPSKGASANIINVLTVILENGTTVYSDPAKIGRF